MKVPVMAIVMVLGLCAATPALAQRGGFGGGGGHRGDHRGGTPSPTALAPLPTVQDPWPRLDAGAKLCRSLADLQALSAAEGGSDTGAAPAHCHLVQAMVGVTVMGRNGPGATQVQLSSAEHETGWTDAYLPDRATPAQAAGQAARHP